MPSPIPLLLTLALATSSVPLSTAEDWPAEPPAARLDVAKLQRLREGRVLVENAALDSHGGAARVQAMFWVEAPRIWSVLGSCEATFRFVRGMQECEILRASRTYAVTRQVIDRSWLYPSLEFVFETERHPYSWIAMRLVRGDLREMQGSWRFDPVADEGTLVVTHQIRVRPSIPSPDWLVRRTLKNDIRDMLACLRWITGGSGDTEQAQQDRKHCPAEKNREPAGTQGQAD